MNDILRFIISLIFSIIVLVIISGFIADSNMDFGIATVFIAIIIFAIPFIVSMALLEHFSEKKKINTLPNKSVKEKFKDSKNGKAIVPNVNNLSSDRSKVGSDNSGNLQTKKENGDYDRILPKSPKLDQFQSNYSESLKVVENIGYNRFQSNVDEDINELIRNGKDNSGETSRILTESYFGIGYNEDDEIDSMENLISFRAAAYSLFGLELDESTIREMAIDYCDNFPAIILCLTYFEVTNNPEKMEFFKKNYSLIYKIIAEEHIKIAERLKRVPVISSISDSELTQALNKIIS